MTNDTIVDVFIFRSILHLATKHAVDAITTSLRFELVDTPIRVR